MSQNKRTQCVHAGESSSPQPPGVTTPIVTSTAFEFPNEDNQVFYPRYFNLVTQEVVAGKVAALENGECGLVLGSGMAAICSTLLGLLRSGDHAIIHTAIYGGAWNFAKNRLPEYGVDLSYVAGGDVSDYEQQITDRTKLIYFESPTNPLLEIVDIQRLADMARRRGVLTVIDNTFGTPINQNPIDLGVDVVVHSGTKYLNGHSDVNCGAIVTRRELMERIKACAVDLGGTLDVRACYLLERGMKTLSVRVERQCDNAAALARALAEHDRVVKVHYPGLPDHPNHDVAAGQMKHFGAMLSLEIDGDDEAVKAFFGRLEVVTPAVSLGGVETLVCQPKDTSHSKLTTEQRRVAGISDSLVRVSVGIEDAEELIEDFRRALG